MGRLQLLQNVKMPIDQIADECDMAEEWIPIPDDEPVEYIEIPGR